MGIWWRNRLGTPLLLLRDEAKFYVSRNVNSIDMQKTHMFIQELPLPDEVFGEWCAANASDIIGSSLLSDQKHIPLLIQKSQQDTHVTEFILSDNCSTCFGYHHPSSGAQNNCNYSIW
jgi:hypothetical protein